MLPGCNLEHWADYHKCPMLQPDRMAAATLHLCTWLSWREKSKLPMITHRDTVWSHGQSWAFSLFSSTACLRNLPVLSFSLLSQFQFHLKFHVSRSGVRIPVKAIFLWCDSNDNSYQSVDKVIQKIFSIDWPLQKVERRGNPKKLPWLGFEPQTWKREICSGTETTTVSWMTAQANYANTL